jgi:hypothetical protein
MMALNTNTNAERRNEDRYDEDCYFDLKRLSEYSGLSVRSLWRYMADPDHPLPNHHVRVGGKERGRILVSKRKFDAWVATFPPARVSEAGDPADASWVRGLAK